MVVDASARTAFSTSTAGAAVELIVEHRKIRMRAQDAGDGGGRRVGVSDQFHAGDFAQHLHQAIADQGRVLGDENGRAMGGVHGAKYRHQRGPSIGRA